ncbi:UNVERIFIED_CONTAM: hypothetical protein K2H54_050786 [Gekko kuhli]
MAVVVMEAWPPAGAAIAGAPAPPAGSAATCGGPAWAGRSETSTPYKWIIPEGIFLKYNDKKERIDSVIKAKAFLQQLQNPDKPEKSQEDNNDIEEDNNQRSHGEISSSSTSEEDSDSELGAAAPKTPKTSRDYYLIKKKEK